MLWPQSANFDMIHFFIYLNSSLPTLFTKTTKDNLMFHDKERLTDICNNEFENQSMLFSTFSYRKIPKISPSKHKPPNLVTQKTLR